MRETTRSMETPGILVVRERMSREDLARLVDLYFEDMVKIVVDVAAVGGELHSDAEAILLEGGSRQENLWGANYYPAMGRDGCIEYTSLINVRPSHGNPGMEIVDPDLRGKVAEIVFRLVGEGEALR